VPAVSTENLLRAHLRDHNLSVLAASGLILIFSAIGWGVLYVVARVAGAGYVLFQKGSDQTGYFTLESGKLVHITTAAPYVPVSFHAVCLTVFGVLLVLAAMDAWYFPEERAVDDRPALETLADIVLFLPRLTLSVFLNFAVWAHLRPRDRREAAVLLDRLRVKRKLAIQELPQEMPDERRRDRILRVLQTTQLVEVRMERSLAWLRLSWRAPAGLRQPLLEDAEQPMAHARARVVEPDALGEMKRALPPRREEER
jgi:hypothetical protein